MAKPEGLINEGAIRVFKESLVGFSDRNDGQAVDMLKQALEVILGEREQVKLPSGRKLRLNTHPSPELLAQLPEGQLAILEVSDPAMDDWFRVHQAIGDLPNIPTGPIDPVKEMDY